MSIPDEAGEAAQYPRLIQPVKIGCPDCSYNNKYGMIQCKEHRGW
jgi:hypothetical protein